MNFWSFISDGLNVVNQLIDAIVLKLNQLYSMNEIMKKVFGSTIRVSATQRAHDAIMTSDRRRHDVASMSI